MKDWYYMIAINIWDNVRNDFNISNTWLITNREKKPHEKYFTIACHIQIYFRIQRIHPKNK